MTTIWDSRGRRGRAIRCDYIGPFDARGMRRMYGRGDHFGRGRTFNMDVWLTGTGRILVRFWARRDEVDWLSLEVFGLFQPLPQRNKKHEMSEDWVPQCLRDEYDNWILSEF